MKWFESWFDTPYYHALYAHRNEAEASAFMDRLVSHLGLTSGMKVLDVACGKGRHSAHLASRGLQVWGLDLSENSIKIAKSLGVGGAHFQVHDMRAPYPVPNMNAVFNLFTSFGYFDDSADDQRVLENMAAACEPGGHVVQDYLNAESVLDLLPQEARLARGGYEFFTRKYRTETHIVKDIEVRDGGQLFSFQEQVRIFDRARLVALHEAAGLRVLDVFGDDQLGSFEAKTSPRIVVVSQKG
ncbi:MAG: class I SAM-dependent methyltransferase [Bacteroidota bacterium]